MEDGECESSSLDDQPSPEKGKNSSQEQQEILAGLDALAATFMQQRSNHHRSGNIIDPISADIISQRSRLHAGMPHAPSQAPPMPSPPPLLAERYANANQTPFLHLSTPLAFAGYNKMQGSAMHNDVSHNFNAAFSSHEQHALPVAKKPLLPDPQLAPSLTQFQPRIEMSQNPWMMADYNGHASSGDHSRFSLQNGFAHTLPNERDEAFDFNELVPGVAHQYFDDDDDGEKQRRDFVVEPPPPNFALEAENMRESGFQLHSPPPPPHLSFTNGSGPTALDAVTSINVTERPVIRNPTQPVLFNPKISRSFGLLPEPPKEAEMEISTPSHVSSETKGAEQADIYRRRFKEAGLDTAWSRLFADATVNDAAAPVADKNFFPKEDAENLHDSVSLSDHAVETAFPATDANNATADASNNNTRLRERRSQRPSPSQRSLAGSDAAYKASGVRSEKNIDAAAPTLHRQPQRDCRNKLDELESSTLHPPSDADGNALPAEELAPHQRKVQMFADDIISQMELQELPPLAAIPLRPVRTPSINPDDSSTCFLDDVIQVSKLKKDECFRKLIIIRGPKQHYKSLAAARIAEEFKQNVMHYPPPHVREFTSRVVSAEDMDTRLYKLQVEERRDDESDDAAEIGDHRKPNESDKQQQQQQFSPSSVMSSRLSPFENNEELRCATGDKAAFNVTKIIDHFKARRINFLIILEGRFEFKDELQKMMLELLKPYKDVEVFQLDIGSELQRYEMLGFQYDQRVSWHPESLGAWKFLRTINVDQQWLEAVAVQYIVNESADARGRVDEKQLKSDAARRPEKVVGNNNRAYLAVSNDVRRYKSRDNEQPRRHDEANLHANNDAQPEVARPQREVQPRANDLTCGNHVFDPSRNVVAAQAQEKIRDMVNPSLMLLEKSVRQRESLPVLQSTSSNKEEEYYLRNCRRAPEPVESHDAAGIKPTHKLLRWRVVAKNPDVPERSAPPPINHLPSFDGQKSKGFGPPGVVPTRSGRATVDDNVSQSKNDDMQGQNDRSPRRARPDDDRFSSPVFSPLFEDRKTNRFGPPAAQTKSRVKDEQKSPAHYDDRRRNERSFGVRHHDNPSSSPPNPLPGSRYGPPGVSSSPAADNHASNRPGRDVCRYAVDTELPSRNDAASPPPRKRFADDVIETAARLPGYGPPTQTRSRRQLPESSPVDHHLRARRESPVGKDSLVEALLRNRVQQHRSAPTTKEPLLRFPSSSRDRRAENVDRARRDSNADADEQQLDNDMVFSPAAFGGPEPASSLMDPFVSSTSNAANDVLPFAETEDGADPSALLPIDSSSPKKEKVKIEEVFAMADMADSFINLNSNKHVKTKKRKRIVVTGADAAAADNDVKKIKQNSSLIEKSAAKDSVNVLLGSSSPHKTAAKPTPGENNNITSTTTTPPINFKAALYKMLKPLQEDGLLSAESLERMKKKAELLADAELAADSAVDITGDSSSSAAAVGLRAVDKNDESGDEVSNAKKTRRQLWLDEDESAAAAATVVEPDAKLIVPLTAVDAVVKDDISGNATNKVHDHPVPKLSFDAKQKATPPTTVLAKAQSKPSLLAASTAPKPPPPSPRLLPPPPKYHPLPRRISIHFPNHMKKDQLPSNGSLSSTTAASEEWAPTDLQNLSSLSHKQRLTDSLFQAATVFSSTPETSSSTSPLCLPQFGLDGFVVDNMHSFRIPTDEDIPVKSRKFSAALVPMCLAPPPKLATQEQPVEVVAAISDLAIVKQVDIEAEGVVHATPVPTGQPQEEPVQL